MNLWTDFILALYPRTWRDRYEDEFRAMLELYDLTLLDTLDMFFSAIDARFTTHKGDMMKDLLNRSSGLIALTSVVMLALALFFVGDEDTAEFLFVVAPMLSLALIPALHRVLNNHAPVANRRIKWVGIAGIGVLLSAQLIDVMLPGSGLNVVFGIVFVWLMGGWLFSVNLLGLSTRVLPGALAIIGIVASVAWLYVLTISIVFSATGASHTDYSLLMSLQSMLILMLMFCYAIWAISLAYLLLTGKISRKLYPLRYVT
ncbi:MAG: hypothetical protein ACPG7F_06500 [Aggregatilineales bacterium]